jgi:hypothetical protein
MKIYSILIFATLLVIACDDATTTSPVYDGPSYEVTDSSGRTGRNLLYIPDGDTIYIDKSSTYPPFDMKITILDEQKETKIIIEGSVGRNVGMAVYSMTVPPFTMTNKKSGTTSTTTFTSAEKGIHNIDCKIYDDFMSNKTFNLKLNISTAGKEEYTQERNLVFIIQ